MPAICKALLRTSADPARYRCRGNRSAGNPWTVRPAVHCRSPRPQPSDAARDRIGARGGTPAGRCRRNCNRRRARHGFLFGMSSQQPAHLPPVGSYEFGNSHGSTMTSQGKPQREGECLTVGGGCSHAQHLWPIPADKEIIRQFPRFVALAFDQTGRNTRHTTDNRSRPTLHNRERIQGKHIACSVLSVYRRIGDALRGGRGEVRIRRRHRSGRRSNRVVAGVFQPNASCLASTGRPRWKPCREVQPSSVSNSLLLGVSTPSAMIFRLSVLPRATIAATMAASSVPCGQVLDEAPIDLQLVGRQLLQVHQAGIAGAEIVDGDAHADVGQFLQDQQAVLGIVHGGGFGDLQRQQCRRETVALRASSRTFSVRLRMRNCVADRFTATRPVRRGRRRATALNWRQASSSTHSPICDDQAVALGQRDEVVRQDQAARGCCQRSSASAPISGPSGAFELRLVMQDQFVRGRGPCAGPGSGPGAHARRGSSRPRRNQ